MHTLLSSCVHSSMYTLHYLFPVPMNRTLLCIVLTGSIFLAGCTAATQNNQSGNHPQQSVAPLATYSGDVHTDGWKTYTNKALGFSLEYPDSFVVIDTKKGGVTIKRNSETASDQIVITKVRSTLKAQVANTVYAASSIDRTGLSIADPTIRFAIAHFQSGDSRTWFMTYFLMKDKDYPAFPDFIDAKPYDVLVAHVEAYPSDEEYQQMVKQSPDRVGPDVFLSMPQQILSTIRLL